MPGAAALAPLVAGGAPTGAGDGSGQGGENLEAEIYLDIRLAASVGWLAPAALMALPALLIVVSLVAQLVGGLLWIPLTKRVLGGSDRRS